MILELLAALLLVFANGFFVATEFALARLRPTQVDEFLRDGKPGARSVRHAVDHIDAYLAACQLGITLASLGLGVVGKPVFHDLLEPLLGDSAAIAGVGLAVAMAFGIITVLHVVVGELAPKSLAIASAGPVSLFLAPPMRLFYLLTKPVVDLFNGMGNLLLKPFGVPPASEAGHAPHSEDELRGLLSQSAREGLIEADEGEFTRHGCGPAPRQGPPAGNRRGPGCRPPRAGPAGPSRARRTPRRRTAAPSALGPPAPGPCRDEHGTVVGLVTLEDVELLSHDGEATLVDGHALRLVAERLGLQLEEPHEATVGGHLLERLGRVPEPGEEVELDGRQAEVSQVEGARIARLRFPDVPSS